MMKRQARKKGLLNERWQVNASESFLKKLGLSTTPRPAIFFGSLARWIHGLPTISRLAPLRRGVLGTVAVFAYLLLVYMIIAIFLRASGLVPLPLGSIDIVVFSILVAIYIPSLTLYLVRRRRRT